MWLFLSSEPLRFRIALAAALGFALLLLYFNVPTDTGL